MGGKRIRKKGIDWFLFVAYMSAIGWWCYSHAEWCDYQGTVKKSLLANENQKLTLNINEILIDIPQKYVHSLAIKTHLKNWKWRLYILTTERLFKLEWPIYFRQPICILRNGSAVHN